VARGAEQGSGGLTFTRRTKEGDAVERTAGWEPRPWGGIIKDCGGEEDGHLGMARKRARRKRRRAFQSRKKDKVHPIREELQGLLSGRGEGRPSIAS